MKYCAGKKIFSLLFVVLITYASASDAQIVKIIFDADNQQAIFNHHNDHSYLKTIHQANTLYVTKYYPVVYELQLSALTNSVYFTGFVTADFYFSLPVHYDVRAYYPATKHQLIPIIYVGTPKIGDLLVKPLYPNVTPEEGPSAGREKE
ncbi:MAG: hypothetical protein JO149_00930 [Gammaproteobacteria bacterium]|nr:hypothetical protein [Gammaproteobacteria bacterium]